MHNLGKCNIIINLSRNITFFIEMKKRQIIQYWIIFIQRDIDIDFQLIEREVNF